MPVGAGVEQLLVNASGTTTAAGGLQIVGGTRTDVAVVRTDGPRITRMLLMVLVAGGRLQDQKGARTLIDLGTSTGALEVAFDGAGNVELSGTARVLGVKFHAPTAPTSVTRDGAALSWTRDAATGLVTVTSL